MSSILLIRSIYRLRLRSPRLVFPSASSSPRSSVLGNHSFSPRPDIIRDVNARRVHHVLSFTCPVAFLPSFSCHRAFDFLPSPIRCRWNGVLSRYRRRLLVIFPEIDRYNVIKVEVDHFRSELQSTIFKSTSFDNAVRHSRRL